MRTISLKTRPLLAVAAIGLVTWVVISVLIGLKKGHETVIVQRQVFNNEPAFNVPRSNVQEVVKLRNVSIPAEVYNLKDKIAELARKIYKAKKHVRGIKTSDNLKEAIKILDEILEDLSIDSAPLKERETFESKSVCPEEYKGTTYGYPFFYKGFEVTDCDYGKPLSSLVTVLLQVDPKQATGARFERLLKSTSDIFPNVSVVLGTSVDEEEERRLRSLYPWLIVKSTAGHFSVGDSWSRLADVVTTPYTFVARNVDFFTNDSRLDRLVREVERLNVAVAAGSHRTPNGHWKNGCFQSAYRNFSLTYVEGYDESLHECLFCDHIDTGPFIIQSEILNQVRFRSFKTNEGLFEDFFLTLKQKKLESVVCPDSMFHVVENEEENSGWRRFSIAWELDYIKTPRGLEIKSSCPTRFQDGGTLGESPCRLQSNADIVNFIMNTCAENNVLCELQEGTALGALKFGKVLPWELDGDITFLSGNYTAFQNLRSIFEDAKIKFVDLKSLWCCADNRTAGGKFNINNQQWNIELYGQHMMDSELLLSAGIHPTQVLLDGNWVNVPRNPGLFVRNRYAHEIYRHAVHWMTTGGSSGWILYKTNYFQPCKFPGHHSCLDRHNADGSITFTAALP